MDNASLSTMVRSMRPVLFRSLHWAGSGLALMGIVFVAFRIHDYWGKFDLSQITPEVWISIAGFSLLYGLANLLLAALAWWQLLAQFGAHVTRLWSIRNYGISQLAKYIPGNIFHLAGRQAIGISTGVSGGVLAKSTLWELGLLVVSGSLYGWLVLPPLLPGLSLLLSIILLVGTVLIVVYLLRQVIGPQVAASFIMEMLFLTVSGGVFVTLLAFIVSDSGIHMQAWLFIGGRMSSPG